MRHDGCANDTNGYIERLLIGNAWNKPFYHLTHVWFGNDHFCKETEPNDAHQTDDKSFHGAHAQALQQEKQEGVCNGKADSPNQGQSGQQLNTDGHPENLSKISGCNGNLGQQIKSEVHRSWICFPVGLRKVPSPDNPQPRRKALKQQCHQVAHQQDPYQLVAKFASSGQVCGPVARVHVSYTYQVGWSKKGQYPPPAFALLGGIYALVYLTQ